MGPGLNPMPWRRVGRAPREAWRRPVRTEQVPGTSFGLVIYGSPPVTSGPATGSLVAGIASVLVALVVLCFGVAGAAEGWGPWVAGAFVLLAVALGSGAVGLGVAGLRRTRRRSDRPVRPGGTGAEDAELTGAERAVAGRGLAVAGLACGASGAAVAAGAWILALVLSLL